MKKLFKNSVAILLVFTMIFTLGVSAFALDEDMNEAEQIEHLTEEDTDETVNPAEEEAPDEEEPPEEEAVPEEDLDQEDEVDQEELDPEPVDEPEPEPEPEEEEEEPQKKEETEEVKEVESKKTEKTDKAEEIEEEYDSGLMLDGFPATPHPENPAAIIRFAPGSLGSVLTSQSEFRPMSNVSGLEPGEVRTSKTATPVPGMVNTWDIKVRVEGRDDQKEESTDVVLVIDRSGSMADRVSGSTWNPKTRLDYAKEAANDFIDAMIVKDPNLRIAIVSFSSQYQGAQLVTINRNFTNDIGQLKSAVNSLNALGGTHTQAGIIQGEALLDASTADNKFMVLLSDGQPTYSYEPSNWTNGRPSWGTAGGINNNQQRTGVYDGNYNTGTVVGTGSDLTQSYNYTTGSWGNQTTYRRHIHNGLAAIKAGEDARTGLDGLFTIAVQAGSTGTPILEQIASPGMAYSTQNPSELQEIYDRIGTQIATQYAIRNAVITDEMGDGFSLISSTITTTEGTTAVATPSGSNESITWTIDPVVTELVPGTTDVRYAEMTYRVEINDDILDISGAKTDQNKLFDTNKFTQLEYKNSDDQDITKDINSPKVDPVLLKIKKNLLGDGAGNVKFNVKISKGSPGSFDHTEELVPNGDYVWLTTLRHKGNYTVNEIGITGDGITDLNEYEITYEIDGVEGSNFQVYHKSDLDIHENPIPRGDVDIVVTNKLIPQTVDVTIKKEITGNFADLNRKFKFTVLVDGDEANPRIFELAHNESKTLDDIPKNAVLTLTEESDDYDVTVKVGQNTITPTNGKYTITLIGEDITIKVNNNRDEEIDTGITFDTLPYILILAVSTLGLGVGFVRKRNIRKED